MRDHATHSWTVELMLKHNGLIRESSTADSADELKFNILAKGAMSKSEK